MSWHAVLFRYLLTYDHRNKHCGSIWSPPPSYINKLVFGKGHGRKNISCPFLFYFCYLCFYSKGMAHLFTLLKKMSLTNISSPSFLDFVFHWTFICYYLSLHSINSSSYFLGFLGAFMWSFQRDLRHKLCIKAKKREREGMCSVERGGKSTKHSSIRVDGKVIWANQLLKPSVNKGVWVLSWLHTQSNRVFLNSLHLQPYYSFIHCHLSRSTFSWWLLPWS